MTTPAPTSAPNPAPNPSPEFKKIISDFVADIATVFPEHSDACAVVYNMDTVAVFEHCKRTYAPQFFNIL